MTFHNLSTILVNVNTFVIVGVVALSLSLFGFLIGLANLWMASKEGVFAQGEFQTNENPPKMIKRFERHNAAILMVVLGGIGLFIDAIAFAHFYFSK